MSREQEQLAQISTESLLVRVNSLEETRRNLDEFSQVLYDRLAPPPHPIQIASRVIHNVDVWKGNRFV